MDQDKIILKQIATVYTDFPTKFGIPRQSGLADTKGKIVLMPKYRNPDAVRGIEQYSHLWILWGFSGILAGKFHPTVRPPKLGGNERVGVFATRSPFRPNPVGLSSVVLEHVEMNGEEGPVLFVSGVDMKDRTPVYDIKPYLPYVDAHMDARGGFAQAMKDQRLKVMYAEGTREKIPGQKQHALEQVLSLDPRPSYQNDPERVYGMEFGGMEIKFRVREEILEVLYVGK